MALQFDVDLAVERLEKHAYPFPQSHKKCAEYVRLALEAGGIKVGYPPPRSAKNYGPALEAKGFYEINRDTVILKKGDIAVIQNYPGGTIDGHIAMYTGKIWISDFKQRDMWSGPGYREKKPTYAIYRFKML
jgi:type VI secretion system secreted protein VgrG